MLGGGPNRDRLSRKCLKSLESGVPYEKPEQSLTERLLHHLTALNQTGILNQKPLKRSGSHMQ